MDRILEKEGVLYLNSKDYFSSDWRLKKDCEVYSNRRLTKEEIVLDFDKLKDFILDKCKIIEFFATRNFKFWLYQSSNTGLHLHFFAKNVKNKYHKKRLIEIIEKKINLEIDKGPVMRNWIRADMTPHPRKGYYKHLIYTNVSESDCIHRLFYVNELDYSTRQKVFSVSTTGVPKGLKKDLDNPKTIQIMETRKFIDGRKQILFCLASFYKKKLGSTKTYEKLREWCDFQSYNIPDSHLRATIKSSRGIVRESFRSKLLQSLGINEDFVAKAETVKADCDGF